MNGCARIVIETIDRQGRMMGRSWHKSQADAQDVMQRLTLAGVHFEAFELRALHLDQAQLALTVLAA